MAFRRAVEAAKTGGLRQADQRLSSTTRARLTFSRMSAAFAPDEGLRVVVVLVDVVADGHNQFLDIAEYAAAEPLLGEIAEEALDHVEPRTAMAPRILSFRASVRFPPLVS
jgi:hypothetical protein